MRSALALLAVLLLPALACAEALLERLAVDDGGRLHIRLDSGRVELISHDGPDVQIEALARGVGASSVQFLAERVDGDVVLTTSAEPWVGWMRNGPAIRVRAWVPRDLAVEIAGDAVSIDDAREPRATRGTPPTRNLALQAR